jgi:hypothetical protein
LAALPLVAVPLQQAAAQTGIPEIDEMNRDIGALMRATDPRDEWFKDTVYDPPMTAEDLVNKCWSQANSQGIWDGSSYCNSIFDNCIWYGFTAEECYITYFVQLSTLVPEKYL